MREVLAAILRYKARLQQENDPKIDTIRLILRLENRIFGAPSLLQKTFTVEFLIKVLKTLRKLSDIEITAGLLKDTGIERTVYKIHKGSAEKGIANFAKQLLLKWKKTTNGKRTTNQIGSDSTVRVKTEPDQYDPHKNWKMAESSAPEADPPHYKPSISVKQEKVEDYDPEQNWQVEDAPQNGMPETYSFSPAVKREVSPSKSKKRRKENGIDKNHDSPKYEKQDFDADREAELIATIQKTQKELRKIREASKKSKVKVKQEPVSPPREEEDVEEYDPTNNYEVSSPPPDMYEPEPAEMDDPPQSPVAYQPGVDYDSEEPQMSDHDAENESPFEEDEPGAYLLHPRRTNSVNQSSHQQETVESDESTVGSSVHATTLFSFTKGSEGEDSYFTSKTKEKSKKIKNVKSVKEAEKTSTSSNSVPKKSSKSKKKDSKPIKIEKAVKIKVEKEPEASKKTQITKKSSKKRKIDENSKEEPRKKQPKPKIKIEKTVVKDAGFLFEDVPAVIPERKKKNKAKKKTMHDHSTVKSSPTPKITLHLPEVKATYRPLPQPSGGAKLKAHKESVLTDSQAAELHTQRQTKKMLVYSGHSGGTIPKMESLRDQCMKVLMNNIDSIDAFGGIPFMIVHPILKKCTPEQLYRLEDYNPYLLEDTGPLWNVHCAREFRGKQPDEMESWREMYLRLSDEREAKLASLTRKISKKEAKKKPLEKKVKLAYVGANAKPPRNVLRAQEKYGTGRSKSSVSNSSSSSVSSVKRDLIESRMSVPEGSITAAVVDRDRNRLMIKDFRKPRTAPIMAKTLRCIGKMGFKR